MTYMRRGIVEIGLLVVSDRFELLVPLEAPRSPLSNGGFAAIFLDDGAELRAIECWGIVEIAHFWPRIYILRLVRRVFLRESFFVATGGACASFSTAARCGPCHYFSQSEGQGAHLVWYQSWTAALAGQTPWIFLALLAASASTRPHPSSSPPTTAPSGENTAFSLHQNLKGSSI